MAPICSDVGYLVVCTILKNNTLSTSFFRHEIWTCQPHSFSRPQAFTCCEDRRGSYICTRDLIELVMIIRPGWRLNNICRKKSSQTVSRVTLHDTFEWESIIYVFILWMNDECTYICIYSAVQLWLKFFGGNLLHIVLNIFLMYYTIKECGVVSYEISFTQTDNISNHLGSVLGQPGSTTETIMMYLLVMGVPQHLNQWTTRAPINAAAITQTPAAVTTIRRYVPPLPYEESYLCQCHNGEYGKNPV